MLVIGAGVVGQVYAGTLAAAGHRVTLVARGSAAQLREQGGVRLHSDGQSRVIPLRVVDQLPHDAFDTCLVCVRAEQLNALLPELAGLETSSMVLLMNAIGLDKQHSAGLNLRVVRAFPGMGGRQLPSGAIEYQWLTEQPTTIESFGTRTADLFRGADIKVTLEPDMDAWLLTHTLFVLEIAAAASGSGSLKNLAADRVRMKEFIDSMRMKLNQLQRRDVPIRPLPIRLIFMLVPRKIAARYWAKLFSSSVGQLTIQPHLTATAANEVPYLQAALNKALAAAN